MVRLDMSEYSERHTVSRLIGAPPGYVGYDDGGQLTEAVRRRPYQLVLLDEFEKAHTQVSAVLLQVLDDGRLTDGQGRTVDFRNTIIVMTSNLGADSLAALPEGQPSSSAREPVMQEVRAHFRPEFLNRIDDTIIFNRLSKDAMTGVVEVQLRELRLLLQEQKLELNITNEAEAWLAMEGYSPAYGARPLRRVIQHSLLEPLAKKLLEGRIQYGDLVNVSVSKSGMLHIEDNHGPRELMEDSSAQPELSP
mmetsp:Transcript_28193/g.110755  ORF Transcript_28193/g.110755 Transcript_28193/m.110755 type:complete len:250 (-) Transcript_28193:721-1470(-)